jgi:flagellin-specific chaperone FliS
MAIDEGMRHRIHGRFEELLGSEEAAALMGTLSQTDRFDEVMRHISTTTAELRDSLKNEMKAEFHAELNQLYRWTVGSILAAASLGVAAGALL